MFQSNPVLKVCPFCGNEAKVYESSKGGLWAIFCSENGERCGTEYCITLDEAVKIWNRRADDTMEVCSSGGGVFSSDRRNDWPDYWLPQGSQRRVVRQFKKRKRT